MTDNHKDLRRDLIEVMRAAGIEPLVLDLYSPEDREQEERARAMPVPAEAATMIEELCAMVTGDPNRGNQHEGSFLDKKTRPRTVEIGQALCRIGGHELMIKAHFEVSKLKGFSARSLEMAWDGVGDWRG
jgi:hypothetical protein